MKRVVWLAFFACLSGCADISTAPQVVTVNKAVWGECPARKVDKPTFAVDQLPIGAGVSAQMKALRVERQQRMGYEANLEAITDACLSSFLDE